MGTAFTGITFSEIVGSVNANDASPEFCVRSVSIADRSSATSAALMILVPAVSLELVKTLEKVAFTDWAAVMVTTQGPVPEQPPQIGRASCRESAESTVD